MDINDIVIQFIGANKYDLSPITDGLINTTYLLEDKTRNEKFILQKINNNVFRQPEIIVNNHLMINELLRSNNYQFQIIEPIPSLIDKLLVKDANGQPWRMLSFVENSITFLTAPSLQTAFEAAKTFSYFLTTINTEKLPAIEDPLPDFLNFEKRISDYKIALKDAAPHLKENAKTEIEITNRFLSLPDHWIEMEKSNQIPKRIIHADVKISNILFDQNHHPLAVIDLDTMMISTILYDFGTMIQSYTNTTTEDDGGARNNFNPEMYKAVKEGFLFHLKEKLTPEESENLDYAAQVAIYIQELRFLTDYLNGSTYYSIKHPEHNLDRTKNQLELLKGLREYLENM
ncbi:aminoglycoside phosphotransferase family protein [Chryseobacterium lactis]|uniref:Aminoglycoside phosphotransferase family protein n=1 Tax=Chryseobacterium lactis TaxID=1241981 RepID=A0A3G6RTP0_CHRLC|nr:aminoglycoside phosphotransferase family protein [Chryseobacterium lactis]AZA84472.1 aminoglycoside phosphotransferase family protein [Chryseobacterium lactis]AZB04860.1 aminoglycoside phosphotransferase family protein [Chryseobacterium lactis]PNW14591.1 aminoglycoside phosphotransferase family protein [Chryseobacterium lactis]